MDGAFAVRRRDLGRAVDADLDDRRGDLALDGGLFADDLVADQVEGVLVLAEDLLDEQHEARLRRLVLVPRQGAVLEGGHDLPHLLPVLVEGGEVVFQFVVDGALARDLGQQKLALVADAFGVDVLEGGGIFEHAVRVHPRLMGKGVHPHIRLVGRDGGVGGLGEGHRAAVHLFEAVGRDALVAALELQVADDRAEVRVAAPLAEAEQRPLHLFGARLHRRDRIRHGEPAVVVAVDGDGDPGEALHDRFRDGIRLVGEDAAVGVAQAEGHGARLRRALEGAHRVIGVRLVPVEEVFGVEHDLFAVLGQKPHALADHGEVLRGVGLDHVGDVADMALAEDGDVLGARRQERAQVPVLRGGGVFAARGAEGDDLRVGEPEPRDALEELHLRRVGEGVARLDEVHAERVEGVDDFDLVLDGKGDVGALRPVAQGGIKNL